MSEVKETKEVVIGVLKLVKVLMPVLKDGVQATDALVVFELLKGSEDVKSALLAAYNDADKVKEELKDLDALKLLDIIIAALPELKDVVVEVAKK